MPIDIQDPPAIYDHDYPKPIVLAVRPLADVQEACKGLGGTVPAGKIFLGCAEPRNDACFIIVPVIDGSKITAADQMRVYRHERAHCNGWPKDHSAAVEAKSLSPAPKAWPWPDMGQSDRAP